ncbi:MAG: zinc-ribbon domain-containing protein [Prevotellaceae bacterium]|jgi:uncharacterized membrane protein YvbJ|nr:zinc-ribbon domain-containing protein [Prevotellaceae bacterium]
MEIYKCKTCGKKLAFDAVKCQHCGDTDPFWKQKIKKLQEKLYHKQEILLKSNMNIWSLVIFAAGITIFICNYSLLNHLAGIAIIIVSIACFYMFFRHSRAIGNAEKTIRKYEEKQKGQKD